MHVDCMRMEDRILPSAHLEADGLVGLCGKEEELPILVRRLNLLLIRRHEAMPRPARTHASSQHQRRSGKLEVSIHQHTVDEGRS